MYNRIISLVPSQTELLCRLGLSNFIVGVTKFCVHPKHIKKTANIVGGTKHIHIERIKALKPNIILCNKEENTKAIVQACKSICTVHVSEIYTLQDSLRLIAYYGNLFGVNEKSEALISKITDEKFAFDSFMANKPSLSTLYFIWRLPWMVAGKQTYIDALLQLNKFENASIALRYPEVTLATDVHVDLVLLSSEPYPFNDKHKNEIQLYYPNAKILLVDGEMFSWHGSRLAKAFRYFKQLRETL